MAQLNVDFPFEKYSVMHPGNGFAAMLRSNGANDVHDFGFIVLIKVSKNLGLAGSATWRLKK